MYVYTYIDIYVYIYVYIYRSAWSRNHSSDVHGSLQKGIPRLNIGTDLKKKKIELCLTYRWVMSHIGMCSISYVGSLQEDPARLNVGAE